MHWLVELLLEVATWFDFRPGHTDRSVVGESELDRSQRRLGRLVALIVLGIGIVAWALFAIS